jgi:hypothetical protein
MHLPKSSQRFLRVAQIALDYAEVRRRFSHGPRSNAVLEQTLGLVQRALAPVHAQRVTCTAGHMHSGSRAQRVRRSAGCVSRVAVAHSMARLMYASA